MSDILRNYFNETSNKNQKSGDTGLSYGDFNEEKTKLAIRLEYDTQ